MEEVLGFLGFSLGASLGVGVVRALGRGLRPAVRAAMHAGRAARDEWQAGVAEARAAPSTPPRSRSPRKAQKIPISRE